MTMDTDTPAPPARTRWWAPLGLAAAGLAAGVVLAGTVTANAADSTPTPAPSTATTPGGADAGPRGFGGPGHDGRDCPKDQGGGSSTSPTPQDSTATPQSGSAQT